MDQIKIKALEIFANHGVFEEEKRLGQKFVLNVKLMLSTQGAGLESDLEQSVNYGTLSHEIKEVFQEKSYDLIETAGEKVGLYILKNYPMVEEVVVEVQKPWAPIGLPLKGASVILHRKRNRVFLGLGSNQGDSKSLLEQAKKALNNEYCKVKTSSKIYQTKAWGLEDQEDFLNQVLEIETFYEAGELLKFTQKIEKDLGRERKIHWGPRTMDIDLLLYNDEVIYKEDLIIPHPYMEKRGFVLEPLAEIAPHFIHPIRKRSILDLWENLKEEESE
ncbi:MAG: 2-amino-4-hydroxy-6-hydroxymethyldihydropteridine diphosphokinase [Tissierellia bacterium]|nr:2-amino-4-hydroxy-6-hydroxymethyldihydropteridine diphosphokinase [Tissierellia bacterium]